MFSPPTPHPPPSDNRCLQWTVCSSPLISFFLSSLPSRPIPSPYLTFSNVSITAGRKPPRCCVCASSQAHEGEKTATKEDDIKDLSCLLHSNVLTLSISFSPLMWPVLISGADIAAVTSSLVGKKRPLFSHWERCSWAFTQTHTHTYSSTFEQWEEAEANRKWLLLRRGMKRSGFSEEHKAKGNFESGEVPTITLFSPL